MTKRHAAIQITQLNPYDLNTSDQDEKNDISNNQDSIDYSLLKQRIITKPTRPSSRITKSEQSTINPFFNINPPISLPPSLPPSMSNDTINKQYTEYDLHIKGLNVSFQQHIQKLLESNPSIDLSPCFQTYGNHLRDIESNKNPNLQSSIPEPKSIFTLPITEAPTITGFPSFQSTINAPWTFGSTTITQTRPSEDKQDSQDEGEDEPVVVQKQPIIDPYIQGPGEEGETTLFAQRGKLYHMPQETKKWTDLGICSLRINLRKDGSTKRLLIKSQDTTEKVMCNFVIQEHFKPEFIESTNSVMFLGINSENKMTKYLFRVKTKEQSKELYDQMISITKN